MMIRERLVTAILIALSSMVFVAGTEAAFADDMLWQGFYVGVQLGGATGSDVSAMSHATYIRCNQNGGCDPGDLIVDTDSARESDTGDGLVFGFHGGYMKRLGGVVLGAEADFSATTLDAEANSNVFASVAGEGASVTAQNTARADYDWFATLVGTLGVPLGRVLVSAKGGLAAREVQFDGTSVITAHFLGAGAPQTTVLNFSNSDTEVGWTVGGDIRYAISPNMIIGVSYQFMDFDGASGNLAYVSGPVPQGDKGKYTEARTDSHSDLDPEVHVVTARLTYLFGPHVEEALK